MKPFQHTQYGFAQYLRTPDSAPAPESIEARRLAIYRDLVFNNIEGFVAGAFPVMRSLFSSANWQLLIRDFIARHRAQTPYFLEISQEFLYYLMEVRGAIATDPPFLIELAHYEWVELALDVSINEIPVASEMPSEAISSRPRVSPLVMNLAYSYPVHRISASHQPQQTSPTFLVVYRNREDQVAFLEANALTHRLLFLAQEHPDYTLGRLLSQIGEELTHPEPAQLFEEGKKLAAQLHQLSVISHFA